MRRIAELGLPIFLDLKLHDIPNTVAKAVAALAPLEPAILTVHAAGGREMLWAAKARRAAEATKVVAVTVLTSLDASDLSDLASRRSPADQVARLAWARSGQRRRRNRLLGRRSRQQLVRLGREGFFVVPGVRPAGADVGRPEARRHAARRRSTTAPRFWSSAGPITDAAGPGASDRGHCGRPHPHARRSKD